jgi:sterol desaturase/sphingolipid hydroxylase (fatty acid hydroxylase superfamily)
MTLGSVVAFLLGHPSSTQFFLFGSILGTAWVAEKTYTKQSAIAKLHHTGINAIFMSGVLPVQIVMIAICLAAAKWATANHFGLVYLLPNPENPWIKYGAMFLALDLLDYTYHFIAHRTALIWRLHLVHHTDEAVDVSTTFREHPAETFIRVSFLTLAVLLCGASIGVLMLRQTVQSVSNVLQHTSFRLPPRAAKLLGWIFVTPNLHHTHHHYQLPGTNCNYGDVFSVWDRLFGTFVDFPCEETVFGLDTHMGEGADTGILGLLGLRRQSR